ncbi:MAG: MipA/OmpV family protein, partial [Alphaproteobacteria bacterium]
DLDRLLAGTRTIDPDVELGLFVEFYGGPWNLGGDIRQGIGIANNSHGSFLAEAHMGYATRLSRRERFFVGLSSTLGGPAYMRTYFNSGTFRADTSLRDVAAYLTVEHDLSQRIFARLVARAQRLLFDAARSTVTDPGSNNQFHAAVQIGYVF